MSPKPIVPDVLADRYASAEMASIWSPKGRIVLERELWIAILRAQRQLGVAVPEEAITAYEAVKGRVDLDSIRQRERRLRHDVKARIEEFCALAGHQYIHMGLTSRDLTENVEQLQVLRSLHLIRKKCAASLYRLSQRAREYRELVIVARTHNVPAQPTTLGRRLAMFGEEMIIAFGNLQNLIERYPLRGIQGAVGTRADQIELLGSEERAAELDEKIRQFLGFERSMVSPGQVYPRSLDFEVVGALYQLAAAPSSFAKTLRLMAGLELASEGFGAEQVGSSAMPHKMNPRSCERIAGLHAVLRGFLVMAASIAGDQWNEGDVSCSAVRRVVLPGSMFATDAILDTFLTVLKEMAVFPAMAKSERERYLPFLATSRILMRAVQKGAGREAAYEAIREHAAAVAREVRDGRAPASSIADRLAGDPRVGLRREEIAPLLESASCGAAVAQAEAFAREAERIAAGVEGAAAYEPPPIL